MCRAGTATACRSNGRSRSSTAPEGQGQGRRADRRVPPGMPRLRQPLGRRCRARSSSASASIGDWDHPYTTMTFAAEAQIVREIGKFLMNGGLYQGAKPVLWSVVEQTALAEAEVEYHDHISTTVWVRFPGARHPADPSLGGAAAVIWTTTPWTLPGNRAIAYGEAIDYVADPGRCGGARAAGRAPATKLIARQGAARRASPRRPASRIQHRSWSVSGRRARRHGLPPSARTARATISTCRCCRATSSPTEQGTGLVHIAPGHGADDWELGQRPRPRGAADGRTATASISRMCRSSPAARSTARRQAGRRQRRGDRRDRRGGRAAGARHARPFLPAFLALEGAADLPQHAAMVHPHGDERSAREGAGGDRRDPLGPAAGPEPHRRR